VVQTTNVGPCSLARLLICRKAYVDLYAVPLSEFHVESSMGRMNSTVATSIAGTASPIYLGTNVKVKVLVIYLVIDDYFYSFISTIFHR
jgi:hypothetical protein